MPRIVYLHGFASGPQSSKAQFFREKLIAEGAEVEIPQLDGGDFRGLSITGQLEIVEQTVAGRPCVLMGSSLGGYLAALYAARHAEIQRLVLLAPAFQFPQRFRERHSPAQLARWKQDGETPIFHYGYKEIRPLGYQLLEDAAKYEDEPPFQQPALIFHGRGDSVVPAAYSEAFAARHSNVDLHLLNSGHELTDVVETIWETSRSFLLR